MKELRDYQLETITQIRQSMNKGNRSILIQQPPRTGKSVIMAEIARMATEKNNRVLFVVHRKELVDQITKTFTEQGVDMNLVQIGMVQTFRNNLKSLYPASVVFIDEAHHSLAEGYKKILNHFEGAYKLLFTATPWRMNGKGFTEVADDLIVGKSIKWLTTNGYLAPFDYYAPQDINLDILKVRPNGEFEDKSITQALRPKIWGSAVENYKKYSDGKQAIAYTHNVQSAYELADEFNKNYVSARAVSGQTPASERDQIIKDYRDGKIVVLVNAELFTEGLDLPNVDTVIMLRPTNSLSLYLQFSMRALNPRVGKRAVIIDHVGNVARHGLPDDDREWTLVSKNKRKRDGTAALKQVENPIMTCNSCFGTFYKSELDGDKCPYCGAFYETNSITYVTDETAELAKVEKSKQDKERRRQLLIEQDQAIASIATKSPKELRNMQEIHAYARLNGYKRGWEYYYGKLKGFVS